MATCWPAGNGILPWIEKHVAETQHPTPRANGFLLKVSRPCYLLKHFWSARPFFSVISLSHSITPCSASYSGISRPLARRFWAEATPSTFSCTTPQEKLIPRANAEEGRPDGWIVNSPALHVFFGLKHTIKIEATIPRALTSCHCADTFTWLRVYSNVMVPINYLHFTQEAELVREPGFPSVGPVYPCGASDLYELFLPKCTLALVRRMVV